MDHDERPVEQDEAAQPTPEPHDPPQLTELGSYAELTQGNIRGSADGAEQSS